VPIPNRIPSVNDSLAVLNTHGVRFGCILDVGVERETSALKIAFPQSVHHLFEPVSFYFESIRENYSNIRHHLHPVAISDANGVAYLNSLGKDPSRPTVVTHSFISAEPIDERTPNFLSTQEISVRSLDSMVPDLYEAAGPYFLKVDVDGSELLVLQGARETLKKTDLVMIEAPLGQFVERARHLESLGFALIDVVDLSYYKGMLWQVDMIFASKSLLARNPRLVPRLNDPDEKFDSSQWFTAGYGA
jgi:FkbM family methyltransferase